MVDFPTGKFNLIYCDPAWSYRDKCTSGQRGAEFQYPCMGIDELKALPVESIAAENCLLAMWWVGPMPHEALDLVKAWGFTLRTMKGFCWRKTTRKGESGQLTFAEMKEQIEEDKLEHFGMGNYTRANSEDCLFATRGKIERIAKDVRQIINAPLREHSRKPDEARDRLVQLVGDVPRIELFARQAHTGWEHWGNEI